MSEQPARGKHIKDDSKPSNPRMPQEPEAHAAAVGSSRSRKRVIGGIVAGVLVLAAIAVCIFVAKGPAVPPEENSSVPGIMQTGGGLETSIVVQSAAEGDVFEADIDFDVWQQRNPDIYAWIAIPGTKVDQPIVQHPLIDNYYLIHNVDDVESVEGAAYTQTANAKDFSDSVTVIYGHTFEEGTDLQDEMFGTLHYFEDPAFFDEHRYFYIVTPKTTLTYEIVSAYEYDDRHILNSFDFDDQEVLQEYFDSVMDPRSLVSNVRERAGLVAGEDSIVQLSTCTRPANDSARYIVTGVLVDEHKN